VPRSAPFAFAGGCFERSAKLVSRKTPVSEPLSAITTPSPVLGIADRGQTGCTLDRHSEPARVQTPQLPAPSNPHACCTKNPTHLESRFRSQSPCRSAQLEPSPTPPRATRAQPKTQLQHAQRIPDSSVQAPRGSSRHTGCRVRKRGEQTTCTKNGTTTRRPSTTRSAYWRASQEQRRVS